MDKSALLQILYEIHKNEIIDDMYVSIFID